MVSTSAVAPGAKALLRTASPLAATASSAFAAPAAITRLLPALIPTVLTCTSNGRSSGGGRPPKRRRCRRFGRGRGDSVQSRRSLAASTLRPKQALGRHRQSVRARKRLRLHGPSVLAPGNREGGLGAEGEEGGALSVHQEVEGLTQVGAVGLTGTSAAPNARLAVDLQPPPLLPLAAVLAAQAHITVLDHVAAKPMIHEAACLFLRRLLGDPPLRGNGRQCSRGVVRESIEGRGLGLAILARGNAVGKLGMEAEERSARPVQRVVKGLAHAGAAAVADCATTPDAGLAGCLLAFELLKGPAIASTEAELPVPDLWAPIAIPEEATGS
mmetsp:Transcript_16572/g.45565  ORF Transcript_16572/g.45565 Transcript_16572/m.45565 type:complete len:328 (-) Transcript_16572:653-1636(-)